MLRRLRNFYCALARSTLALFAILVPLSGAAYAADVTARFCLLPVKDGAPTPADVGETWRLVGTPHQIPGLAGPVYTPDNRRGQWTIGKDRALVPYIGPFPKSYLDRDNWKREPWSDRIVASTTHGGISVLKSGSNRFESIDDSNFDRQVSYRGPFVLPRRDSTVVISPRGIPFIVGSDRLRLWLSSEQLTKYGGAIESLHDSPLLSATIIIDRDNGVHALTDEDEWERLGTLAKSDYGTLYDAPKSGAAVLAMNTAVLAIRRIAKSGRKKFIMEPLVTRESYGASCKVHFAKQFGEFLAHRPSSNATGRKVWQRLSPKGFEDIPGGDFEVGRSEESSGARTYDLPVLGMTLIEGRDGFYFYNVREIRRAEKSPDYRNFPRVYDLPSIGRVLIATTDGLYELTREGKFIRRDMPVPIDGSPMPRLLDWPKARGALISTRSGLFVLNSELDLLPVQNGEQFEYDYVRFSAGFVEATGEAVLASPRGLFTVTDTQFGDNEICKQL